MAGTCCSSFIPSPCRGINKNLETSHSNLPNQKEVHTMSPSFSLNWGRVEMMAKKKLSTLSDRNKGCRATHWIGETVWCPKEFLHGNGIYFSPPWYELLKPQKWEPSPGVIKRLPVVSAAPMLPPPPTIFPDHSQGYIERWRENSPNYYPEGRTYWAMGYSGKGVQEVFNTMPEQTGYLNCPQNMN